MRREGEFLPQLKIFRRKFWSCPQLATQFVNWVPRSAFRISTQNHNMILFSPEHKIASDFRCGDDVPKLEPIRTLHFSRIDKIVRDLRRIYKENPSYFDVPAFAQKVY